MVRRCNLCGENPYVLYRMTFWKREDREGGLCKEHYNKYKDVVGDWKVFRIKRREIA